MVGIEHTRGKAVEGEVLPDDHNDIGDALQWVRLTYALDYPARPDFWDRPEDYPQSWDVRAYIDADVLESDYDTIQADAQGRIPVAEARVYVLPDVGAINLFETLDAHSAELSHSPKRSALPGPSPACLPSEANRPSKAT